MLNSLVYFPKVENKGFYFLFCFGDSQEDLNRWLGTLWYVDAPRKEKWEGDHAFLHKWLQDAHMVGSQVVGTDTVSLFPLSG